MKGQAHQRNSRLIFYYSGRSTTLFDPAIKKLRIFTCRCLALQRRSRTLLAPAPLAIVDLPQSLANIIRDVFNAKLPISVNAPARVTVQPFGERDVMIQNYNQHEVSVRMQTTRDHHTNALDGMRWETKDGAVTLTIPGRSRIWLQ